MARAPENSFVDRLKMAGLFQIMPVGTTARVYYILFFRIPNVTEIRREFYCICVAVFWMEVARTYYRFINGGPLCGATSALQHFILSFWKQVTNFWATSNAIWKWQAVDSDVCV
jgi:hypothetical protein